MLLTDGVDMIDDSLTTLANWYWVYDADFGRPLGDRYMWNGLFRRDFENGIILVNEPSASTKTVSLDGNFLNTSNNVSSFLKKF